MSRVEQAYRRLQQQGGAQPVPPEWPPLVTHGSLEHYSSETVDSSGSVTSPRAEEPSLPSPAPIVVETPRLEPAPPAFNNAGGPRVQPLTIVEPHTRVRSVPDMRPVAASGEPSLITGGTDVVATEQYSRLAASLHEAQVEQGLRTLMVTSALPREGKTLTCVNLAMTLGEIYGRRVLLIDADLRRPSVHLALRMQSRSGLGEALRFGYSTLPIVTVTPQLSVLLGGRRDASPVADLASEKMKSLIEQVRSQFDWIILDTPPVGLLPDANLIARWADGVLLVVAARSTPYRVIQDAMERVGPSRVIGSVLNRSDRGAFSDDYYARYYPDSVAPAG